MDDIAIGRKEIMKALKIGSWKTIREKKRKYPGFRRLIKKDPTSNKPVLILAEYRAYLMAFNRPTTI